VGDQDKFSGKGKKTETIQAPPSDQKEMIKEKGGTR
jgi:hypothetical protein